MGEKNTPQFSSPFQAFLPYPGMVALHPPDIWYPAFFQGRHPPYSTLLAGWEREERGGMSWEFMIEAIFKYSILIAHFQDWDKVT